MPLGVALAYCVLLLANLRVILTFLYWGSDASVAMILSREVGARAFRDHFYLPPDTFYNVELADLATQGLAFRRELWVAAPVVLAFTAGPLMFLAARRACGRDGALVAAALAVAVTPGVLTSTLVQTSHLTTWINTLVLVLAGPYLVTSRLGPPRWLLLAVVAVVTGVDLGSDPLLLVTGVLPCALAALLVAVPSRAALASATRRAAAMLAVIALVAVGLVVAMQKVGFVTLRPGSGLLVSPTRAVLNFSVSGYSMWEALTGLVPLSPVATPPVILATVAGAAAVVVTLLVVLRRQARGVAGADPARSFFTLFWTLSALGVIAGFTLSPFVIGASTWRYLTTLYFAFIALGVVLATSSPKRMALGATLLALYALFNGVSMVAFARNVETAPPLAAMLQLVTARGLSHGYAGYNDSGSTTWNSGLRVAVRPVLQGRACGQPEPGAICGSLYTSAASWYRGTVPGPSFVVVDHAVPSDVTRAPTGLGPPADVLVSGPYTIYVYDYDAASRFAPPRRPYGY